MNSTPFFSVIMPTYGVEKYLQTAVCSVLEQSFCDCEIIIVDDASPDASGKIADELAKSHENISVIHHKENKGLSQARNSGLDKATGEFVFFMDPDDVIEADLFESIKSALEKQNAQLVIFGITEDYYNAKGELKNSIKIAYSDDNIYLKTPEQIHKEVIELEKKTFYGYAWNKVYRHEYLKKINARFEDVVLIEDIAFNVDVFNELESAIVLKSTPYHYMKRIDSSLTNKFVSEYYEVHKRRINMLFAQHENWNCCTDYVKSELGCIYARYILSAIQRNCDKRAKMSLKARLEFIREIYNEELFSKTVLNAKSENKLVKIILKLLKNKSVLGMEILGEAVYFVKAKLPMLFSNLKQNK